MSWDLNTSIWEPVILDPANGPRAGRAITVPPPVVSPSCRAADSVQNYWAPLVKIEDKVVEDQMVLYGEEGGTSGHQPDVLTGTRSEAQVVRGDMIQQPVSPPPGFERSLVNEKTLDQRKGLNEVPTHYVKEVTFGEVATAGMRVYPCPECAAIFYTPQKYAAHFGSHYRNETPEARKKRRASKTKVVKLYPVFSEGKKLITLTSKASDCEKLKWGFGAASTSGSARGSKKD